MKSHEVNKLSNFIAGWYIEDTTLCDDIIDYFRTRGKKNVGYFATANNTIIDKSRKDSTDALLDDNSLYDRYLRQLKSVTDEYKKIYSYCDVNMSPWGLNQRPNIQYYKSPAGGYHQWHTERAGHPTAANRHLVYMTYLNDVTDGGETEWYYQQVKIKPEKGLTVIWPTDWNFTHKGNSSATQDKYIITGWFYFL